MTADGRTIDDIPVERWTFIGVRVGSDGKPVNAWLDPDRHELWFGTGKGVRPILGHVYDVHADRANGSVTIWGRPAWTGERHPGQEEVLDWRAAEIAAETQLAEKRAIAKARRENDALGEAMMPLLRVAAGLRTGAEWDAFAAHVLRRLRDARMNPGAFRTGR